MAFHIICIIREQKSKSVYHQNYLSTWYIFENFKSLIVWVSLTAVLRELANPFISMLTQIIRNRTTNHESGNNQCEQNGKSQQSCSYVDFMPRRLTFRQFIINQVLELPIKLILLKVIVFGSGLNYGREILNSEHKPTFMENFVSGPKVYFGFLSFSVVRHVGTT